GLGCGSWVLRGCTTSPPQIRQTALSLQKYFFVLGATCSAYAASKASGAYISGATCGAAPRTGFSGLPGFFSTTASTVPSLSHRRRCRGPRHRPCAVGGDRSETALARPVRMPWGRHLPDRGVLTGESRGDAAAR